MSAAVWQWPALDLQGQPAPERLQVGRAVWGKVHGAASDFRWIAHSPGLDPQARHLERELLLGSEDALERAFFWRALGSSYCAVTCYPSRAVDAARRSGFLEKQLLEWTPMGEAPAALGALMLLPRVARFTDDIWWTWSGDPGWARPGFTLALEPEDTAPACVSERDLTRTAESSLAALREAVAEPALAALYSSLLAERRPAILPGLDRPLPPEALAALLLPLPRPIADSLSLAGWIVSQHIDADTFTRLWDVLLCKRAPAVFRAAPEPEVTPQGREAARAVFAGEPPRSSRSSAVAASGPPRSYASTAGPPEVIARLVDFATSERRWLDPEDLAGGSCFPLRLAEEHAGILTECLDAVQAEIAALSGQDGVLRWKREQLRVKADLLRAASLALAPSTVWQHGLPDSGRVPALLFCPQLGERDWDRLGTLLGEAKLGEAIHQSLSCRPALFGKTVREWLAQWSQRTRNPMLARLLEQSSGLLP